MILQLKLGQDQGDGGIFQDKFGVNILERFGEAYRKLRDYGMLEFDATEVRMTRETNGLLRVDQLLPEFYHEVYRDSRYT